MVGASIFFDLNIPVIFLIIAYNMFWLPFHIQDLESQTDENLTPIDNHKSSKRAADVEHESDGSSMKKQIIEIKKEKEAAKWRLFCSNK